jgi:hypothetical protein
MVGVFGVAEGTQELQSFATACARGARAMATMAPPSPSIAVATVSIGGRLGTKEDAQDHLNFLQELSAEVKAVAPTKCTDAAMKEIKLPKYEKWSNYEQYLPGNIQRYCYWWTQSY